MKFILAITLCISLIATLHTSAFADKKGEGIACRSVHLGYTAPQGVAFYNEITVEQSAEGTYFAVIGFNKGYFGIQELSDGKKVVIFSVWDPGAQNDPKKVADDQRVKLLHKDDAVRIGRFGNEGTGGQSFLDFDWKIGETYRFLVKAQPQGERTAYSGYFFAPEEKKWRHLVTFSTITTSKPGSGGGAKYLSGAYSFVEDFRRNKISATKERKANFGNAWVKTLEGKWQPVTKAQFTADSNPVLNINAGLKGDRFFLTTGGQTTNTDTPLWKHIERKQDENVKMDDLNAVLEMKPTAPKPTEAK